MDKENQALRHNEGKLQWSLIDYKSLEDLVRVLEFGVKKYARDNWKKGMPITELYDSMHRHMTSFIAGEDIDEESGLSHLGHAMCNLMFMSYMMREKREQFDNRVISTPINQKRKTGFVIQDTSNGLYMNINGVYVPLTSDRAPSIKVFNTVEAAYSFLASQENRYPLGRYVISQI